MVNADSTLPGLLLEKARRYGNRAAMREKHKGIWREISWNGYLEKTCRFARGLAALGFRAGDHAAILGENCPQWVMADLAVQSLGGVSVGIYPSNSVEQVRYILDHSRSRIVVVKDQEQADKVLAARPQLPDLETIVVIDGRGMAGYSEPGLVRYADVEAAGGFDGKTDAAFQALIAGVKPDDIAFIVYTSGTTGPPKGAMISHRSIIHQIVHALQPVLHFSDKDIVLSYLPLCHIFERNLSMAMPLVFGYTVNFSESVDTVQQNIREISPTFFAAVPRILEKLHSGVMIRMEDSTRFKRFVYRLFMPAGETVSRFRMARRPVPLPWRLVYALGFLWVFRPVREKIGLLRCRCLMSGGAPIAPEVLQFFRSLGVHTVEMYGLTEACGGVSGPHGPIQSGSVGQPCAALACRIAEDGEILLKGDSIFSGYFRDPAATGEVLQDGWYHTGDIGEIRADGHLYIVDRKKDIIITSGGKNISPSEIENRMKCSPYIKEAVVIGDGRNYLTALVQIDYENVGNWAQNRKIAYTTYRSLARDPDVHALIRGEIDEMNRSLARVEQIKKFAILEKELDQDDEELTATQKVKRKVVEKKFEREVRALYGH